MFLLVPTYLVCQRLYQTIKIQKADFTSRQWRLARWSCRAAAALISVAVVNIIRYYQQRLKN